MSWRGLVARSFKRVLMNTTSGAARTCKWNGRELDIVEAAAPAFVERPDMPGVIVKVQDIVVISLDMPRPPVPTEIIHLDGEAWSVVDVNKGLGHVTITLGRHRS